MSTDDAPKKRPVTLADAQTAIVEGGYPVPTHLRGAPKPRPNLALREAAEEADRNMHVFRRGLEIRAARRAQEASEQGLVVVDERVARIRHQLSKLAGLCADQPDETLVRVINQVFDFCGGGDYRRDLARLTHEDVEWALDRAWQKRHGTHADRCR